MVKNTLELHRKLRRYHQSVRITKRQVIIKVQDLKSKSPDFSLGTYSIKPSAQYALLLRIDLPKDAELMIDYWGMTPKLQRLNCTKITHKHKDIRQNFHTYPNSKYIFFSFKSITDKPLQYIIHYLYLESKYLLARGINTPIIPPLIANEHIEYGMNCQPKNILDLNLNDPLKIFSSSINLEIFESNLIDCLFKHDTSYIDILKKNIDNCRLPMDTINLDKYESIDVTSEQLINLRDEINKKYKEIEDYLIKINDLINSKKKLENMLAEPDDSLNTKIRYEQRILFYQNLLTKLDIEKDNKQKLRTLNNQTNLKSNDIQSISEILLYYDNRLLEDYKVINTELSQTESELTAFNQNIFVPFEDRLKQQQMRLDQILNTFRKMRQKCVDQKLIIDKLILKFISFWYQWIRKMNYQKLQI